MNLDLQSRHRNFSIEILFYFFRGGILIKPSRMEFWQGQSNRLHDRFVFRLPCENEKPDNKLVHPAEDGWVYERLAP